MFEKHIQTAILTIITALILWIGGTVSDNKDGLNRLTVIVENALKAQEGLRESINIKADKEAIIQVLNENALQWTDIKLNNEARQAVTFMREDLKDLGKKLEEHLDHHK